MPDWVKAAVDLRVVAAGISAGKLFRCVCPAGKCWGVGVTERVVWHVVKDYAKKIGLCHVAPTTFVVRARNYRINGRLPRALLNNCQSQLSVFTSVRTSSPLFRPGRRQRFAEVAGSWPVVPASLQNTRRQRSRCARSAASLMSTWPARVVLPERQRADRQQQSSDRCALSALLIHAIAVHQDGDQENRATQPNHSGNCSNQYCPTASETSVDHRRLHFFLDSVCKRAYKSCHVLIHRVACECNGNVMKSRFFGESHRRKGEAERGDFVGKKKKRSNPICR